MLQTRSDRDQLPKCVSLVYRHNTCFAHELSADSQQYHKSTLLSLESSLREITKKINIVTSFCRYSHRKTNTTDRYDPIQLKNVHYYAACSQNPI